MRNKTGAFSGPPGDTIAQAPTHAAERLVSMRFRRGRGAAIKLSRRQRRLIGELSTLMAAEHALVHGPCVCGESTGSIISHAERYGLALDTRMCAACGTLRIDPYLSESCLAQFYVRFYQELYARVDDPQAYFGRQYDYGRRVLAWAQARIPSGSWVVEIGCGAGGGLAAFQEAGYRVTGYDYASELLEHGRQASVPDLHFGGIESLSRAVGADDKIDLMLLHHVFEHLADPLAFLLQATRLLSDRGIILIAVPDIARIDEFRDRRCNLRGYLHVAHKFNFTINGLDALATRVGLQASTVDLEPSTQSPELWVAYARNAVGAPAADAIAYDSADALYQHLRRMEKSYLRRESFRRIGWHIRQTVRSWMEKD